MEIRSTLNPFYPIFVERAKQLFQLNQRFTHQLPHSIYFMKDDLQVFNYEQVRELALAQHVDDNKISIGVWAKQHGYSKKKKQKDNRVYTIYIKINNDKIDYNK